MSRNFWLIIMLFVMGMFGCGRPDTSNINTAEEPVNVQANTNAAGAGPVSPPLRVTKKYSGVAVGDRRLWGQEIKTESGFDRASRAAILFYALELDRQRKTENQNGVRPSVVQWLDKELRLAQHNYQAAAAGCRSDDWTCIGPAAGAGEFVSQAQGLQIPAGLDSWQENITEFMGTYVAEQIHLASVFPVTSSEIEVLNDNELSGDRTEDRKFFLTFDDGPTAAGGTTESVLKMLAAEKKTAVFFVLGQNYAGRQKGNENRALAGLYEGQCVGAHGWEHLSHEKNSKYAADGKWQESVTSTISLIRNSFDGTSIFMPLFRPPYGQRKRDSGPFFQKEGLRVVLWNLDSQDWNNWVEAEDVINRIEMLMLIKRHGILLFHDIHPKAQKALPVIFSELGDAVVWGECHGIEG